MSKQTVYRAIDFAITEGQLEAFEGIAQTMVAGTQKEPGAPTNGISAPIAKSAGSSRPMPTQMRCWPSSTELLKGIGPRSLTSGTDWTADHAPIRRSYL